MVFFPQIRPADPPRPVMPPSHNHPLRLLNPPRRRSRRRARYFRHKPIKFTSEFTLAEFRRPRLRIVRAPARSPKLNHEHTITPHALIKLRENRRTFAEIVSAGHHIPNFSAACHHPTPFGGCSVYSPASRGSLPKSLSMTHGGFCPSSAPPSESVI